MKESFYFPHDYNASSDDKLLELRGKYGNEGYAVFWYAVETMASRGDGYLIPSLIGGLSLGYGVGKGWLSEFLEFCVSIQLFEKDDKGYFSPRLIKHLEVRKMFSDKGREGAKKRWGDRGAISTPNAKERKGKESKSKKSARSLKKTGDYDEEFNSFWLAYPASTDRKGGKGDAYKIWKRLDSTSRRKIPRALEFFSASKQWKEENGKYIPGVCKWLNQRYFDNIEDDGKDPEVARLKKELEIKAKEYGVSVEDFWECAVMRQISPGVFPNMINLEKMEEELTPIWDWVAKVFPNQKKKWMTVE